MLYFFAILWKITWIVCFCVLLCVNKKLSQLEEIIIFVVLSLVHQNVFSVIVEGCFIWYVNFVLHFVFK